MPSVVRAIVLLFVLGVAAAAPRPAVVSSEPTTVVTVGELVDIFTGREPGWRIVTYPADSQLLQDLLQFIDVPLIIYERSLERAELSGKIRRPLEVGTVDELVEQIIKHDNAVGFVGDRIRIKRAGSQLYIWRVLR